MYAGGEKFSGADETGNVTAEWRFMLSGANGYRLEIFNVQFALGGK